MVDPVPNTGPIKFVPLGVGLAAGVGVSKALDHLLVSHDRATELAADGVTTIDSREATVYGMALPFGTAAGIGLGMQKRSPTAGFTTASQLATAALLSTAVGAVVNADSDKAGDYVTGISLMSAATGAGILVGVRDEVPDRPLRLGGLGLFGLSIGMAGPVALETLSKVPGDLRRSFEHRER